MYNMYYDGGLVKRIWSYKKYYKIAMVGFSGLIFYFMVKHKPNETSKMIVLGDSMIRKLIPNKLIPNKYNMDKYSSLIDLTGLNRQLPLVNQQLPLVNPYITFDNQNQNQNQIPTKTKRIVSETKKKYVASMQGWTCGECKKQLNHTFEVDHKIRLDKGGNNDVSNLVALCRECHGIKTARENM